MTSRRDFVLATALTALFANKVVAKEIQGRINWPEFQAEMTKLANTAAKGQISNAEVVKRGMEYLRQLDINLPAFKQAVDASYESGNQYWLWQRLIKLQNINGGILNIANDQLVQLHDHPGAVGLVRIISGETEVWQFDEVEEKKEIDGQNIVRLVRTSHTILRAGDTAVLTPTKGNIHALKSISKECRMLDFFIPPYDRSQRSWYQPITENWFNKIQITCMKISQNDHSIT
ncbi:MAG: hypothetical protein QM484_02050 [Woeseiaceae bacterium]